MKGLQKYYLLLMLVIALPMLMSCSKDNDDKPFFDKGTDVQYFVKYEASSSSRSGYGADIHVEYTSEDLKTQKYSKAVRIIKSVSWNGTFGPFKKGQVVTLSVSGSDIVSGRISIAADNAPFCTKKEGEGTYSLKLSYEIE